MLDTPLLFRDKKYAQAVALSTQIAEITGIRTNMFYHMILVVRKLVFGVSDQV